MAIRIREVDGHFVALCARCSKPKEGDIYLHDGIHHALTTKFGLDWWTEGFMEEHLGDDVLIKIMDKELDGTDLWQIKMKK